MAERWMGRFSESLNYDFCPWANDYVYWLKKPIGWLFLSLAASILLGIVVSPQAFLATAAILSFGIIGCLWPWIAMQGLRGQLEWSHLRCHEGESVETTLILTNRFPWPVWGLIVEADDAVSKQVDAPQQPVSLSRTAALARSRFQWFCQPAARGVYPQKPVRLATAFPFGLWTCHRELRVARELIVWPRMVRLSDVPERSGSRRSSIGSVSSQLGNEGEWMGVRPYRPGDSLRQVHWAQTARRDSLVVFERQARSRQSVSIWLDPTSTVECEKEVREWLIRTLASVTHHFTKHAWEVRAGLDGRWQSVHASQSSTQEWFDRLARWTPNPSFLGDSLSPEMIGGSKTIVIATASRVEWIRKEFGHSSGMEIQWILLGEAKNVFSSEDPDRNTGNLYLDYASDRENQFQQQWKRACQRASQLS